MQNFFWGVSTAFVILGLAVSGAPVGPGHPAQAYVEGEVIVTFKPSVTLNAAQQALGGHSLVLTKHFAELSRYRGRHSGLIRARNRTTAELIAELNQDPAVELAEPNYLRWVTGVPNDTLFANLWGLQNTGQYINGTAGTAGDDIRFVAAWGLARPTTNQIVVAVIDTGADYTHPDLAGNMWTNPGEIPGNGVDDDGNGYVDDYYGYDFADNLPNPMDSGYHGTHVAGTIAAVGNNQLGVIGVDYQARIMALRASSDGNTLPDSAIIEAIQYATMMKDRGVNIVAINESFGGGGSNSTERAAMQAAGNVGIIFCVAAGNNTANNDTTAFYPASYRLTNMIVVAATDQNDALASFSDYGSNTVDLAAPGVNILSALPVALGRHDCLCPAGFHDLYCQRADVFRHHHRHHRHGLLLRVGESHGFSGRREQQHRTDGPRHPLFFKQGVQRHGRRRPGRRHLQQRQREFFRLFADHQQLDSHHFLVPG